MAWKNGRLAMDSSIGQTPVCRRIRSHADLKRKPIAGGTERTIQTIDDGKCVTFLHQLSSNDGLYYYNDSTQQIERMPLSEPFTPVAIKAVTTDTVCTVAESDKHLYWPAFRTVCAR